MILLLDSKQKETTKSAEFSHSKCTQNILLLCVLLIANLDAHRARSSVNTSGELPLRRTPMDHKVSGVVEPKSIFAEPLTVEVFIT